MGEAEQVVIAEPDGEEEEEVVEGLHPPSLMQQNPRMITSILTTMTSFLVDNGWYVLAFLVLGYITWTLLQPRIEKWLRKREEEQEASEYRKNPDILLARHQAIDEARQKMQEQYNRAAAIGLEKKKEREEKMREEKIAEWECMQSGRGHRLKPQDQRNASINASSSSSSNSSSSAKEKPATKPRMRPEYNPLTGDTGASSSCRWRPSDRGSSGGG